MFRLIVLSCAIVACYGAPQHQFLDERDAKIVKEQRFNAGDGRAGAAYATENEIVFREETGAAGERIGQYSYIGDDGQTYTVKYSAGKEGFRILGGDHVPSTGRDAAAFVEELPASGEPAPRQPAPAPVQQQRPQQAPQQAPQQRPQTRSQIPPQQRSQQLPNFPATPRRQEQNFQPAPVRQAAPRPQPVQQAPRSQPIQEFIPDYPDYYDTVEEQEDLNPFVNPHDPTHLNFAHNKNGAKFAPKIPGVLDASNVPNCAGCEGLNPFINPWDATHSNGFLQTARIGSHAKPAARRPAAPRPAPRPAQQRPSPIANARPTGVRIAQPQQQVQLPRFTTTPAPKRFFPPGQLKLNRFESGFNFDFES